MEISGDENNTLQAGSPCSVAACTSAELALDCRVCARIIWPGRNSCQTVPIMIQQQVKLYSCSASVHSQMPLNETCRCPNISICASCCMSLHRRSACAKSCTESPHVLLIAGKWKISPRSGSCASISGSQQHACEIHESRVCQSSRALETTGNHDIDLDGDGSRMLRR